MRHPTTFNYGKSWQGRDLRVESNCSRATLGQGCGVLLIGGVHGDEPATVELLQEFSRRHLGNGLPCSVAVLPLANPDGLAAGTRYNARGVDLNRNFPHRWSQQSVEPAGEAPLSEVESVALRDLVLELKPCRIVSLHWALAEVEADGPPGNPLAEQMWSALTPQQQAPYRLRLYDTAFPPVDYCPGSMGQWCGHSLHFGGTMRPSMVTLELPYAPETPRPPDPLPSDHLQEVQARWREDKEGYLHATFPAVEQMLLAACGVSQVAQRPS